MLNRMDFAGVAAGLLVLLASTAGSALASDGVIEINQVRALAGGVTPGDAPGFPVEILEPGSYRLTGDLTIEDPDGDAIRVGASDVTIDLNGFAIVGPCGGPAVPCSPTGRGSGILGVGETSNLDVRNGTIRGMGDDGIHYWFDCRVENVRMVHNGGDGADLGACSVVSSLAVQNGSYGIYPANSSTIERSAARGNGSWGIYGFSGVQVTGNIVASNVGGGILVGDTSLVIGNTVMGNEAEGISVGSRNTVANNSLSLNGGDAIVGSDGNVVTGNAIDAGSQRGIWMQAGGAVSGNSVSSTTSSAAILASGAGVVTGNVILNGGTGFALSTPTNNSGYGNNVVSNSGTGISFSSGGREIDCNLADGVQVCP